MSPRKPHNGFTLLELLIAIIILAIITGIVYGSFSNVARTTEIARAGAEDLKHRQFIWRSFSVNMSSVYAEQSGEEPGYQFIGTNDDGPYGPADAIEFCTALEMPGATAMPGQLRLVNYSVIEASEVEGEATGQFAIDAGGAEAKVEDLLLEIYEAPLSVEGTDDGFSLDTAAMDELAVVRHVPIRSMDILYYDDQLEDWAEEWDSTAQKRLPWAVRIRINLARSADDEAIAEDLGLDDAEDADLDMSFAIPIAAGVVSPFTDPNHMRQDLIQEDPNSIFNEEPGRRQDGSRRR